MSDTCDQNLYDLILILPPSYHNPARKTVQSHIEQTNCQMKLYNFKNEKKKIYFNILSFTICLLLLH